MKIQTADGSLVNDGIGVVTSIVLSEIAVTGEHAIAAILFARWVSVIVPVTVLRRWREFTPGAVTIMTWGGLRGGISVALALALPAVREREIVLALTYIIVIFSILAQDLTLGRVVRWLVKSRAGRTGYSASFARIAFNSARRAAEVLG